jgi:hypothetical protein
MLRVRVGAALTDFLTALRSGRPMRRKTHVTNGPSGMPAEMMAKLNDSAWIHLLLVVEKRGDQPWISLIDGGRVTVMRDDYLADDWEIM